MNDVELNRFSDPHPNFNTTVELEFLDLSRNVVCINFIINRLLSESNEKKKRRISPVSLLRLKNSNEIGLKNKSSSLAQV